MPARSRAGLLPRGVVRVRHRVEFAVDEAGARVRFFRLSIACIAVFGDPQDRAVGEFPLRGPVGRAGITRVDQIDANRLRRIAVDMDDRECLLSTPLRTLIMIIVVIGVDRFHECYPIMRRRSQREACFPRIRFDFGEKPTLLAPFAHLRVAE